MLLSKVGFLIYRIYIWVLAIPLMSSLWFFRWKRKTILRNLSLLGIEVPVFFLPRFYHRAARDFFLFLHGRYDGPIHRSLRSARRLEELKAQPAILLTAHFHHWELMGNFLVESNVSLLSGARLLRSPWGRGVLRMLRRSMRSRTVSSDLILRALEHLRGGGCFGFVWDQYSPESRLSSDLIGQPAAMNPAPLLLKQRTGVAVFFGVILPGGDFRLWKIATAGDSMGGSSLARRYHRFLGKLIKSYPTCWYGLAHRRFKDVISYDQSPNVSRETSAQSGLVSRGTSH